MDHQAIILNDYEIFKKLDSVNGIGADSPVLTEDPLVFKTLCDRSRRVKPLDSCLTAAEMIAVDAFASRLCLSWVATVNEHYRNYDIPVGQTLNNSLYYLANTVLYRAIQLKRSFAEFGTLDLPHSTRENFFSLLAGYPPFDSRIRLIPLETQERDTKSPNNRGYQVIRDIKLGYLLHYLAGIASCRTKITSRILDKIIPEEAENLKFFGFGKTRILLQQPNDLIEGKILSLLFRARFARLKDTPLPRREMTGRPPDEALISGLKNRSCKIPFDLLDPAEFEGVITLLARRCSGFISSSLLPAYDFLSPRIKDRCARAGLTGNAYFFSGGLTEPAQLLVALIYSSCGVPTIGFQEGGACLLKLYDRLIHHGHISHGDAFVAYHENEEIYFKKRTRLGNRPFFILGTRKLLRAPFPRLSSLLGKIVWRIPRRLRTILYLPTKFQEEVTIPAYQAPMSNYWNLQKRLALQVFPRIDGHVIIKLRQKGLITTENRKTHPLQLLDLPPNVELKSSPDFRYIRYSADILIVDYATSTLGWALATDKPTVYLHHHKTPLEDEVRELMKEALFLIDIEEGSQSWEEELLSLLNRDKKTLIQDWKAKEAKRTLFLEKYIWGKKTANKGFVDWLQTLNGCTKRAESSATLTADLAVLEKTAS